MMFVCGLILDTSVKGQRRSWELEVMRIYDEENQRKGA